jgi:hypothetical protein
MMWPGRTDGAARRYDRTVPRRPYKVLVVFAVRTTLAKANASSRVRRQSSGSYKRLGR